MLTHEQQGAMLQELHNVTKHIAEHKVMSEEDVLKQLKNSEDVHNSTKELSQCAKDHYSERVVKNVNILIKNIDHEDDMHKHIEIHGHKFDCPIKYLKHEIANPAHAYADIARFKKGLPGLQQHIHQMELKKEMQYSIGGMSM